MIYQTVAVLQAQEPYLRSLDSLAALQAWRDLVFTLQRLDGPVGCPLGSISSELPPDWTEEQIDLAGSFALWENAFRRGLHAMYDRGDFIRDADPDALALAFLVAVQFGVCMEREMLTISEASRRIGVSVTTLRKWADAGLIAAEQLPGSDYRRFDPKVVEEFILEMKESEPGKIAA